MGHIPSVDICFSEDEENFLRETYIFKSLNRYDNDMASYSYTEEMKKIIEVNDLSERAIKVEQID